MKSPATSKPGKKWNPRQSDNHVPFQRLAHDFRPGGFTDCRFWMREYRSPRDSVLSRPRGGSFLGDGGKRVAAFAGDVAQLRS
jgi:hypothetical protein